MSNVIRFYWPEWKCYLRTPVSMTTASMETILEVTNGCGRDGIEGVVIPDSIYGLDISPVCRVHDWMYGEAQSLEDEQDADSVFAENLVSLIQQKTSSKIMLWLRLRRAYKYIDAVVLTNCVGK